MALKIRYETILNKPLNNDWKDYKYIVGIDPSGNIKKGKGHIGFVIMGIKGTVQHVWYQRTYYLEHESLDDIVLEIRNYLYKLYEDIIQVSVENYIDYQMGFTRFEEPETYYVVRMLTNMLNKLNLPYTTPNAVLHKTRFSDDIFKHNKFKLTKAWTKHSVDALRMCLYWYMFSYEKYVPCEREVPIEVKKWKYDEKQTWNPEQR